jgi:hypothetical protein
MLGFRLKERVASLIAGEHSNSQNESDEEQGEVRELWGKRPSCSMSLVLLAFLLIWLFLGSLAIHQAIPIPQAILTLKPA